MGMVPGILVFKGFAKVWTFVFVLQVLQQTMKMHEEKGWMLVSRRVNRRRKIYPSRVTIPARFGPKT